MSTDIKSEIRFALSDPGYVLEKLGMMEGVRKSHTGYMICCPWHNETEPSCSVRFHPTDGTLSVHCFGCGSGGDIFSLVAAHLGLHPQKDFKSIVEYAGGLAGIDTSAPFDKERQPPVRNYVPPPPPVYPPEDEISDLWFNGVAPTKIKPARLWFEIKGLSAEIASANCRVIPKGYVLPEWAISRGEKDGRKWESNWIKSGHRLLFPMYDCNGQLRSLKARCLDVSKKFKNQIPKGFAVKGLIMADHVGHGLLVNGNPDNAPYNLVFCEGEVDFLVALQTRDTAPVNTAIFGVYSGGWSVEHALRMGSNRDMKLFFFTDRDRAGMAYKQAIAKTFLEAHKDGI